MSDAVLSRTEGDIAGIQALKPFAVPIPKAQPLLGDKSRSEIYEDAARPEGDPLKLIIRVTLNVQCYRQ